MSDYVHRAKIIGNCLSIVKKSAYKKTALTKDELLKLTESFFSSIRPNTQRGYNNAIRQYCEFVGVRSPSELIRLLFQVGPGKAHCMFLDFRNHLQKKCLAPGTINSHISAIRQLVNFANTVGVINWKVSLKRLPYQLLRDTRGPGREGMIKMLAEAAKLPGLKAIRAIALLRVFWDLGFRRGEVEHLDVSDVDLDDGHVWVLGKMRTQKEKVTLPPETIEALKAWLGDRRSGPLFMNLVRGAYQGKRMSDDSIYALIRALGKACGIRVHPHGIRHAAITDVLDLTNGDVRSAQRFARHKTLDMVLIYDDNRKDIGGVASKLIARHLPTPPIPPAPTPA